jgi:hypothetical protein
MDTKIIITKKFTNYMEVNTNYDMKRFKSKFNHKTWQPKVITRSMKEKKVETKIYFDNIWKHKHKMKETRLWCKIVFETCFENIKN